MKKVKLGVEDFVPPVVGKGRRWLRARARSVFGKPGEQAASYYDTVFSSSAEYRRHYTASIYYPSWTVLVDRLRRAGAKRIIDIGCGPGQFAELLRDEGFRDYQGLDFSARAIEMARARAPELKFTVGDALQSELVAASADVVISLEFLEHVEFDLEVLRRIRPGTHVLLTVPNFPSHGHVRHFTNAAQVHARYGELFVGLTVDRITLHEKGTALWLLEGRRAG